MASGLVVGDGYKHHSLRDGVSSVCRGMMVIRQIWSLWRRGRGQGEGLWPRLQGNGPAVSLKNDNGPNQRSMLMRLVLVGWLSMERPVIGGWAWGRGRSWVTAGIQSAWSRLTSEREEKIRAIRREREGGRPADTLHNNARFGPVLMCFLFFFSPCVFAISELRPGRS